MLTGVICGSIGCALLAVFGLYRIYQYYIFHHRVFSSRAWPETAGTIVGGTTGYTRGMRGGRYYYATLEYRYPVQGQEYTGVLKKQTLWGEGHAKRILEKYPPESSLKIHYNPAKPEDHLSVLDKSRSYLVVSLIVFIIGLLGVISAFAVQGS